MKKKHLTEGQRYEISAYLKSGKFQKEISEILGFYKSTLSREIKRNSDCHNCSYRLDLERVDAYRGLLVMVMTAWLYVISLLI